MRNSEPSIMAAIVLMAACTTLTSTLSRAESPGSEESFEATPSEPHRLGYLQYLPAGYDAEPDRTWPLLVFLHGAGERGGDLELVKKHGPPKLAEAGKDFPFIVIAPQCPQDSWWPWEPVMPLIEHIEATLRVDPDRIYLTGLSMGGYGTWNLAARYPDKFAAVAPICGGGVPFLAKRLPHLPVWAFHGAKDTVVALEESERMIAALKRAGNTHAWLKVYPEAGHDSWTATYEMQPLYRWMLNQKRGEPVHDPTPDLLTTPVAAADGSPR